MAQKKPKKTKPGERHPVTLRFNDNEMTALQTDRREVVNGGVPVSFGAYAKHAVMSYPRLRKLEKMVIEMAADAPEVGGLLAHWRGE